MEVELVSVQVQAQIQVDAYGSQLELGWVVAKIPQAGTNKLGNFWTNGARTMKPVKPNRQARQLSLQAPTETGT